MPKQYSDDPTIGVIRTTKSQPSSYSCEITSNNGATDLAKVGGIVLGGITFGYAALVVCTAVFGYPMLFSEHGVAQIALATNCYLCLVAIYWAWHAYKSTAGVLNCTLAWMALQWIAYLVATWKAFEPQYWVAIAGLLLAIVVVIGSIAVSRFDAAANAQRV